MSASCWSVLGALGHEQRTGYGHGILQSYICQFFAVLAAAILETHQSHPGPGTPQRCSGRPRQPTAHNRPPPTMSSDVKSDKATLRSSSKQRLAPTSDINELHARLHADPRFNPPTPSVWKRAALVVLVVFLFWLGASMRKSMSQKPEVIHTQRCVSILMDCRRSLDLRQQAGSSG